MNTISQTVTVGEQTYTLTAEVYDDVDGALRQLERMHEQMEREVTWRAENAKRAAA